MRLRKLAAAATAAAMLGSVGFALPVVAATQTKVYPDSGVHVRANVGSTNDKFGKYNTLNVTDTSETTETKYEMQWGNQFAAIYEYDLSGYMNHQVDSISIYTDDDAYSVMQYTKKPENNASDPYEFKTFVDENIGTAPRGKTISLTWDTVKTGAVNGKVYLVLTRNSNNKWEKYIDKKFTPYLTINSTPQVVYNATTEKYYYTTLLDAVNDVESDNNTIKVMSDSPVPSARITVGKNLTIESDNESVNRKVTVKETEIAGGLLLNQNRTLTLSHIDLYPHTGSLKTDAYTLGSEMGTVVVNNGEVTGDVKISKSGKLTLNNTNVTGRVNINDGTLNIDSNTKIGILQLMERFNDGDIVVNGTGLSASQIGTLYDSTGAALTGYHLEAVEGGLAITADTVAPSTTTQYFTFTLENASYNTAKITLGDGKIGTKSIAQITGPGSVTYGITEIPEGTTVTGMVLEGILND